MFLNGEKFIANNSQGVYTISNGVCSIRIEASRLFSGENIRNVVSFVLLDDAGNYIVDDNGRVINNFISLIRSSNILSRTYTIRFETNGGSTVPNINVEEGNRLSLPTEPTKEFYNFMGWYEDREFQKRFDANEYIINDKTLYALWRDIDINILDIDGAASRLVVDRRTGASAQVVNDYSFRDSSGNITTFKRTWTIDNNNLIGANKENYIKNWINFPYFLIKSGEKYWDIREETVDDSDEFLYARLHNLDNIYMTEETVISDIAASNHPYTRSNSINITGNLRIDTYNAETRMKSGGVLPYNTYE